MTRSTNHNEARCEHYPYKIGDRVMHPVDRGSFIVTGVRMNEIRILGDWSGGTNPYLGEGEDWVHVNEVKPECGCWKDGGCPYGC